MTAAWLRHALALVLLLAGAAAAAVELTDDRGQTLRLAAPPQRIVSLLPSLTESVCALGACARLVGVDRYSNWPAEIERLPRVGGGLDPNIEAIVALRPDVVLAATSSRSVQRLEALGIAVLALEPRQYADVRLVLKRLDRLLATDRADAVWRGIEAGVEAAAAALPPAARGLRVYFEVSPGPWAAGSVSFTGELMARLGARNVVPPSLGPFPKLNPEFVVRADPDLIVVSARAADGIERRPGWSGLAAVRGGRVCRLLPAESDTLLRPGPRLAEGAQALVRCLAAAAEQPARSASR